MKRTTKSIFLKPTTEEEIVIIISKLKLSSPGWDDISAKILKCIYPSIVNPLTKLINSCIETGIFPDELKVAKVIPIFKKGNKTDFTNYRPISVLPAISKIFEKIIYNRLYDFIEGNNILYEHQYGFRKKYSIEMALAHLSNKLTTGIDANNTTIGIFIDLSKAFDTINHNILLNKIEHYGIRGTPNKLIRNYLTNRKQYIIYNGTKSNQININYGVPQGSILGPLLFLLYINDLNKTSNKLNFILCADDTSIYYTNKNENQLKLTVNDELKHLSTWFKAN